MGSRLALLSCALFILSVASPLKAQETSHWGETLTGDWGGLRTSLSNKGVSLEFSHKSDVLLNTSGGIKTGSVWLANTGTRVRLDMGKLAGWSDTAALVQYHAQHGNQAKGFNGGYIGSFSGMDNIETGVNAAQFYQAWLETSIADNSFSVLAGLYAIDSEFYVTDSSGLFLQPPYGMSAEMAQTGQSGPSVFPVGALALRLKYSSSDIYVQGVLTDGVPDSTASGTSIKLDRTDGTLSVVELGYRPHNKGKPINKTSVGLWNYSASSRDILTGEPRSDRGFYVLAERTLIVEDGKSPQGLSAFVRYGVASKDIHQSDWSGSIGLHYLGLIDGRDNDEVGIAMTTSHAGDKYQQATPGSESSETAVELTYRAHILPWLSVQPSLQRILNPGMDNSLGDASVVGVRVEIAL